MTLVAGLLVGLVLVVVLRTRKRAAARADLTAGIAGAQPVEWDGPGRLRGSVKVRALPACTVRPARVGRAASRGPRLRGLLGRWKGHAPMVCKDCASRADTSGACTVPCGNSCTCQHSEPVRSRG